MIFVSILKLVIGFLLLVKGADYFVEGASSVAKRLRIPVIIIGLTIVAFGTSAPELAVSISAGIKGSNDIAIGNVIGSNLFNTLVVLGISAAIAPIAVEKSIIKKDFPLTIFVTVLLGVLSLDMILFQGSGMTIGRVDGLILLLVMVAYMYTTVKNALKERETALVEHEEQLANMSRPIGRSIIIMIIGLAGIVIGGDVSVEAAKEIARTFGLSEALIGLTIVAIGTSLPELVTSVVAARRGESAIAVGNAIGSNIFNVLFILGVSAVISPMNVSATYLYDIVILIIVMIAIYIPIAKTKRIGRGMGIGMIAVYVIYMIYLIMR